MIIGIMIIMVQFLKLKAIIFDGQINNNKDDRRGLDSNHDLNNNDNYDDHHISW